MTQGIIYLIIIICKKYFSLNKFSVLDTCMSHVRGVDGECLDCVSITISNVLFSDSYAPPPLHAILLCSSDGKWEMQRERQTGIRIVSRREKQMFSKLSPVVDFFFQSVTSSFSEFIILCILCLTSSLSDHLYPDGQA